MTDTTTGKLTLWLDSVKLELTTPENFADISEVLMKAVAGTPMRWFLDGILPRRMSNTTKKKTCLQFFVKGKKFDVPKKRWQELKNAIQRARDGEAAQFSLGFRVLWAGHTVENNEEITS